MVRGRAILNGHDDLPFSLAPETLGIQMSIDRFKNISSSCPTVAVLAITFER
jgi:hypothetical protein